MTAAIYAKRSGLNAIILEKLGVGGQIMLTGEIENYPGFARTTGAELAMAMYEQVEGLGVETIYDEIQTFGQNIVTCIENEIAYKAMILCVGASPRKTGAEGEEELSGINVHYCAICDGAFYRDKDVVIIGGGNSAVEEAIYMRDIAKTVTIITDKFIAQQILMDQIKDIPYQTGKVKKMTKENVTLDNGTVIKCDGIFVSIGRIPNTEIFDLEKQNGYIITDEKMQTSAPGIYAAGDCIAKHVRQIITACSDGAIAATHAGEYIRTLS